MKNLIFLILLASLALAQTQPTIGGCPIFPANNIWNTPVDTLPVHSLSLSYISSVGADQKLRLDDVIPVNVVPSTQPKISVNTGGNAESDPGGYAIPPTVVVEAGSDEHVLVVEQANCLLYELYNGVKQADASWVAGSAAKWDLRSNALRPAGWTSADAAGLPIAPGILRYDEMAGGQVNHALRVTAPSTQAYAYVWPARHYASHNASSALPMMGQRFRLKAGFDISGFSPNVQVILRALKKYGVLLADNGMAWGMQHDQDPRWNAADLLTLHNILGSSMEAVDTSSLCVDPDSGATSVTAMSLLMTDALGRKQSVPLGAGFTILNGVLVATGSGGASAVTSVAGRIGDVSLGINDISGLSTALGGKQNLLAYAPEQPLTFSAPLVRTANTIACPTCGSATTAPTASASAKFLKTDTATLGNWKTVYGADGYGLANDSSNYPAYVAVTPASNLSHTWADSTTDSRALQKPAGADRVAGCWYSGTQFVVDLNFRDQNTHQVAVYFVDWDYNGRNQKVEILDSNGSVLDTRTVSSFSGGQYLTWLLTGKVTIRVTNLQPFTNGVISGIFFR